MAIALILSILSTFAFFIWAFRLENELLYANIDLAAKFTFAAAIGISLISTFIYGNKRYKEHTARFVIFVAGLQMAILLAAPSIMNFAAFFVHSLSDLIMSVRGG